MDTTTKIKNNLISRIKASKDVDFLKALQHIFDSSELALYQLSPSQEKAIENARTEIIDGKSIENDSVITELKEWLSKK